MPDAFEVSTIADAADDQAATASYYGGGFGCFMSVLDFVLQFSSRRPSGKSTPVCEVILSPQHAKLVSLVLAKQVAAYEAQNGRLNIPSEIYTKLGLPVAETTNP